MILWIFLGVNKRTSSGSEHILTIHLPLPKKRWSGHPEFLAQGVSLRFSTARNWLHGALRNTYQVNKSYNSRIIPPSLFHHKYFVRCWSSLSQHLPSKERIASISWKDIDNWLVDYSVKNQDIEEALHGISLDLRDLEGKLFNIKIQNDINVGQIKNYIEEWFKK